MLPYKNEAADDYRMLAGIYNRKETRKVSPIGQKDWSKWRDVGQIGYTQKDKQRDERYTYPVVQTTSGAVKTLAGLVSSPSCATGAGCAGAAYLLGTGVDDVWTGIRNFGKDAQEHEDSIRIQAATAAGVPRKVAAYTDFALDMAAGAAVSKGGGIAKDIDPPNYSSSGKITGKLNYGWGDLNKSMLKNHDVNATFKNRMTIGDLEVATRNGKPAIVAVKQGGAGHAVVIDGVTNRHGVAVVAIRDPWGKQYFETVESFQKRFLNQGVTIK